MPAIRAVERAEAVLHLERLARVHRLLAPRERERQVIRVHELLPRVRSGVVRAHPGVLEPAAVEIRRAPPPARGPDDLRHRVRELPVTLPTRALARRPLLLVNLLRPLLH